MPESLAPAKRKKEFKLAGLNPLAQIGNIFTITRLRWLIVTGLCHAFPFAMFTTVFAVLVVDKLHWAPDSIGLTLLAIGCVDIVMQGILAAKLIARWGEVRLTIVGLMGLAVGFVFVGAIAIVPNPVMLFIGIAVFSVASGLVEPSLNALTSNATLPDEQGTVQGSNTALKALANVAAPILAGQLYIRFGGQFPYWSGAAILFLGIIAIYLASRHIEPQHLVAKAEPAVG